MSKAIERVISCKVFSNLTRRQICWWCKQMFVSPVGSLTVVSLTDHKSTSKASKLCAVFVPTTEPKQSLFHMGAVGQELPLNYEIIYYFWNRCSGAEGGNCWKQCHLGH